MATNMDKMWRWGSKTHFASKPLNKVVILEPPARHESHETASQETNMNVSLDSTGADKVRSKSRLERMRRSGSKFLSLVGLQRNSDTQGSKNTTSAPSEKDVALAIARDAAVPDSSLPFRPVGDLVVPQSVESSRDKSGSVPSVHEPHFSRSDTETTSAIVADDSQILSEPTLAHIIPVHVKRPSFAHQLSHKLSTTFGNPTIVHRPNLRTRLSVLSIPEDVQPSSIQSDQEPSPQDSTAPSSLNYSGSVSQGRLSTAKTSLDSNTTFLRRTIVHEGNENPNQLSSTVGVNREKSLAPIQEVTLDICPTVVTIETTANAKIFFETHFNALLAGYATPRSIRRRDLELHLEAQALPEEQRQMERCAWANSESDHLRQLRVLKSKTNGSTRGSGVTVAGYEVVRILGKGSFGVVRLVKEKDFKETTNDVAPTIDRTRRQAASSERSHLRTIAIGALKSTLEGQKPALRRSSAKPRAEVYAMKVIRKSDMLRNYQEGHLRAERDFLVSSENSRWVVPLIASFQDNTNLYLVMEYMVGGDFLGLLFRKNILKEKHAKWYIAEMILGVEETHRCRWIHRDIKPDNFLISASGHLKISDFGLAFDGHWAHDQRYFKNHRRSLMEKLGIEVKGDSEDLEDDATKAPRSNLAKILTGRLRAPRENVQVDGPGDRESILQWRNRHGKRRMAGSVVGTSQYMAPEVIRGGPYDGRCDWWSIGIILYECLYGFTPFVCENKEDTKARILNNHESLDWPTEREVGRKEKISIQAMDLINSLLQEKEHRLSSKKYRMNDWQHSRRVGGRLVAKRADPQARDYKGYFVYPDDASDIKKHVFFERVAWDRLHLTRPPFVPDVSGKEDTKYFDEEEPISDVDDAASDSSEEVIQDDTHRGDREADRVGQGDGAASHVANLIDGEDTKGGEKVKAGAKAKARARAKKRPRDRVLRDKEVGRKALEVRKKGAFLGYTYRRPKLRQFDDERGRQRAARRSLLPSFEWEA